jgi:plasmid stabilization system protein ParE
MAQAVRGAVQAGEYTSSSEISREALRDWRHKRALQEQELGGFIDALERAYAHIGVHPAMGSPRYAVGLDLPGLRSWPPARYPHIVFYCERDGHIDVWRVVQEGMGS